VLLLLGEKWIDFAPIFSILTFLTIPAAIGKVATQVNTSTGKVKFLFMYDIYSLILMGSALFYFSNGSLEIFSTVRVLVEFLTITALFVVATHKIFGRLLVNILLLFSLYSLASFALAYLSQYFFIDTIPYLFSLAIVFVVYAVFSLVLCWLVFVLFLVKNQAAHHAIFILKGAKDKCFSAVKIVVNKVIN
jgi:O-antigen/teichoic acid export membrane protein